VVVFCEKLTGRGKLSFGPHGITRILYVLNRGRKNRGLRVHVKRRKKRFNALT